MIEYRYFQCACESPDHLLVALHEPGDKVVTLSFQLKPNWGFWRRLKLAFQYLFGINNYYYQFVDSFLGPEEQVNLINYLQSCQENLPADNEIDAHLLDSTDL